MPADPEAQFRAAFEKIGLVLREAGLGALVEMTSYQIGLREHFALWIDLANSNADPDSRLV